MTGDPEDFGVKEAIKTGAFWHLALAMGFRLFAKSGLHVHLIPPLVWRGIDEATGAVLVGLFAFTQVPLRLLAAWAGDRWSMTRIPALASLAGVAACLSMVIGPEGTIWTGVAFVLLFALAESGNLVSWALIGDFYGRRNFATLRGALSFVHSPMALPSPVLLGWVFDQTDGYQWALVPMGGTYATACLFYLLLRRPAKTIVR